MKTKSKISWVLIVGLLVLLIGASMIIYSRFGRSKTDQPILPGSWYSGSQMLPTDELKVDSDWKVTVDGKVSAQGLADSTDPKRNLVDLELLQEPYVQVWQVSTGMDFATAADGDESTDIDQGVVTDYLANPLEFKKNGIYVIYFSYDLLDAIGLESADPDTMKYLISPTTLARGEESAITFALYNPETRQFHQICIPFRGDKDADTTIRCVMTMGESEYRATIVPLAQ